MTWLYLYSHLKATDLKDVNNLEALCIKAAVLKLFCLRDPLLS